MKIDFKYITLYFLGVIIVAAIGGYLAPASVSAEQETQIQTYKEKVYGQLLEGDKLKLWIPWLTKDPEAKIQASSIKNGMGVRLEWDSKHPALKRGSMEITESVQNKKVVYEIDFESFGEKATMVFTIKNLGNKTPLVCRYTSQATDNPFKRLFNRFVLKGKLEGKLKDALDNFKLLCEGKEKV